MTIQRAACSAEDFLRFLAANGSLSPEGSARAAFALSSALHPLDTVLTELGLLREDELVAQLCAYLGHAPLPIIPEPEPQALEAVGLPFLTDHALLPLTDDGETLSLAVCDPFARPAVDALAFHLDRTPALKVFTRSAILARLKDLGEPVALENEESRESAIAGTQDVERLRDIAREAPVVRLVSRIIAEAVERKATDIHVEPGEDGVRIRLRLDGMLATFDTAPHAMHAGIVTRVKILAQLNIAERRMPQDGRMRVSVKGQNVDMRVSVVPSAHGEAVVLRILDTSTVQLELGALGFDQDGRKTLSALSQAQNGILLITGPTGSGKTTTLYSLLKERNAADTKIFTVEDPIEYRLAGVTQLQVDPAIDLTFAAALRSVLRQDPDVILVGEIRDRETAEIAIRAALTGHLVLSTLHTNSAASAFTRLHDIGIDRYLLGATVRGVVGQRLLRRACQDCGGDKSSIEAPGGHTCLTCRGTGYSGRVVAYETLKVTEAIAGLIGAGGREDAIETAACGEGMIRLRDNAAELVRLGITTQAEMRRVIQLGED